MLHVLFPLMVATTQKWAGTITFPPYATNEALNITITAASTATIAWVFNKSGAGIICDPNVEKDLKVSVVPNYDRSTTSTVHFTGDGTASQYYSFTANLSADGQTLTGGIVGKAAAHIQLKLNAPQVPSACKKPAPTPTPPAPAVSIRVYPLPAHVTKTPLAVGGPISIDADLVVTSARSLTAPFGGAVLARYQLLLRNKASARAARNLTLRLMHVVVDVPIGADDTLGAETNEKYALNFALDPTTSAAAVTATVTAATIYGARHGLETLAQLVEAPAGIIAEAVSIVDFPMYSYRGLMIDSSRHFLSLSLIRHAIDGLAALKMNVLHWHLIDTESFPIASEAYPQLSAAGAFAAAATYTLNDLRAIVAYAKQRGVRVIPEIEMPGHGSFNAGMPELTTSSCTDVLDPTRNSTYAFLSTFLAEMTTVFDDELIYLGGDEVGKPGCTFNGTRYHYCGYHCFDTDPTVAAWMAAQTPPLNSTELLQYFWQQVSERVLLKVNRTAGVWMSDTLSHIPEFVRPDMTKLPAGSVANVYQDWQAAAPLLDAGTPVVLSIAYDDWYLDYRPDFTAVYNVRPCDPTHLDCDAHPQRRALLRGGSASMWGETVDATNWDSTVWPGTTALAERLWSDPPISTVTAAAAQARHHALACHWKMWGVPTLTRLSSSSSSNGAPKRGSEYVTVLDAHLPGCPADWCSVPP
jgi:hexosaminidase